MWVAEYHNDGREIITTYDPSQLDTVRVWYSALVSIGELRGFQIGDS